MKEEYIKSLMGLRSEIVADIKSYAVEGGIDDSERLRVIMELIRGGDYDIDLFNTAYSMAKVAGDEDKLQLLLDILFEIDQVIGAHGPSAQEAKAENIDE